MKGKTAILGIVTILIFLTGTAWAGMAVPVSPGGGTELTAQSCPTFSWSASDGAQSYRVEVYEQVTSDIMDRNTTRGIGNPVVKKEIPAPALSWTPSTGECLSRGMRYVWYVEGVDAKGEGQWSGGQGFQVEAAALSADQKEAVQEVVKGYLSGESSGSGVTTNTSKQAITPSAITPSYLEGTTNSFFGNGAGASITTGGADTFIGAYAGYKNTTGYQNSFLGGSAGEFNTTGYNNSFIGLQAGLSNTTGSANSFLGAYAGNQNTTGSTNSFFGASAGELNTTGYQNSFLGYEAGFHNTGNYNTFLGYEAGNQNTTGSTNSFLGNLAGYSNTTGNYNTLLGYAAGDQNTAGNANVFLGYFAGYSETGSNKLYIDDCYTGGNCTQPLIEGDFAARTLQIDGSLTIVSIATPSDIRFKKDIHTLKSSLEKVLKLRGVTYEWDKDKVHGAGYKDGKQIGLIAQEVEKVLPELVHTDSDGYKSLSYDKLGPVLIEAMKEQQKEIEEKDARIAKLEEAVEEQKKALALQQAALSSMMARIAAIQQPANTVALK